MLYLTVSLFKMFSRWAFDEKIMFDEDIPGLVIKKWKLSHQLLDLLSFQTHKTFVLLWNKYIFNETWEISERPLEVCSTKTMMLQKKKTQKNVPFTIKCCALFIKVYK